MSINIATTVTTLLLASITLPLTLTHPACAQFNSSAIEDSTSQIANPSRGLQILQQDGRDDRTLSMGEVGKCIDADGLEKALRHGIRAIEIDESNGYAYFCAGASIIIYTPEDAKDAVPYLEHSYKLFQIEGDGDGMQMIEEFLERIANSNGL
jgi:hypothetical protein